MSNKFKSAYDLARERFRALDQRQSARARAQPLKQAVAKRNAAVIPFTPKAISILKPAPQNKWTISNFVREEFREAQRKASHG